MVRQQAQHPELTRESSQRLKSHFFARVFRDKTDLNALVEVLREQVRHLEAPATEGSDGVDRRDVLERALSELPPEQQAVVELTYFGGYSYAEIAAIVGCPVNTVKTRMFHARAKLRRLLPSLGEDGAPRAGVRPMSKFLRRRGP